MNQPTLGAINRQVELKMEVREFAAMCKALMLARGDIKRAGKTARELGPYVGPRATYVLENSPGEVSHQGLRQKAAVDPGSQLSSSWGSPLSAFEGLATAFLSSLSSVSLFDALLPSMLAVPLRTSVKIVTAAISGNTVVEASVKGISRLSISASDFDAAKCAAVVVVSEELLKFSPQANALLQRELQTALSKATNTLVLSLLSPVASIASSGFTALGVRQDLRTLLSLVTSGAGSALYFVTTRKIAEALSVLPDSAGGAAFPGVNAISGGTVGGVPLLICDECTDGEIWLIDASQFAAGSEGLRLDASREATLNLDTLGESPVVAGTVTTSLWQMDLVGLKIERMIGLKQLRSDAAAKITAASYSGNSPV